MKLGIIFMLGWVLIHIFKKLGVDQTPCGLLSGFLASIITNAVFYFLGEPGQMVVLSIVGMTTMSVVYGFLLSRKIYGLPGLFQDAQ